MRLGYFLCLLLLRLCLSEALGCQVHLKTKRNGVPLAVMITADEDTASFLPYGVFISCQIVNNRNSPGQNTTEVMTVDKPSIAIMFTL